MRSTQRYFRYCTTVFPKVKISFFIRMAETEKKILGMTVNKNTGLDTHFALLMTEINSIWLFFSYPMWLKMKMGKLLVMFLQKCKVYNKLGDLGQRVNSSFLFCVSIQLFSKHREVLIVVYGHLLRLLTTASIISTKWLAVCQFL